MCAERVSQWYAQYSKAYDARWDGAKNESVPSTGPWTTTTVSCHFLALPWAWPAAQCCPGSLLCLRLSLLKEPLEVTDSTPNCLRTHTTNWVLRYARDTLPGAGAVTSEECREERILEFWTFSNI